MIEEIKYAQTDEGKAEKARKRAEAEAKREAKKLEKETASNPDKAATKLHLEALTSRVRQHNKLLRAGHLGCQLLGGVGYAPC
jgi:hypothetical protein